MTSNIQIETYAKQVASALQEIAEAQGRIKDILGSAKDAGVNVKALRKVAREMCMDSDKRDKLYDDEDQIDMFRSVVGLIKAEALEAAE